MISCSNKETSFVCPYTPWVGDSAVVLAAHATVTKVCNGKTKYGYVRMRGSEDSSGDAPSDLSIGRTWRGDHFCEGGHAPPLPPKDQKEVSRDGLSGHDKAAVAHLAIPTNLREQGDGLYVASRDESGNINVNFTPMEVLAASNLTGNTAPSLGSFEVPNSKVYKYDYNCTGTSKNEYDLVWAHEVVGKFVSDAKFPDGTWVWMHK